LPFFMVPPGETDVLFIAVAVVLVLVVLGFGALYFTVQAWPDRLAKGVGTAQLQVVGILGLLSLLTLNNALWVAALLLAAIRIPDIVTPLRDIAGALTHRPAQPSSAAASGDLPAPSADAGPKTPPPQVPPKGDSAGHHPGTGA
jgi:hypothetical protein